MVDTAADNAEPKLSPITNQCTFTPGFFPTCIVVHLIGAWAAFMTNADGKAIASVEDDLHRTHASQPSTSPALQDHEESGHLMNDQGAVELLQSAVSDLRTSVPGAERRNAANPHQRNTLARLVESASVGN